MAGSPPRWGDRWAPAALAILAAVLLLATVDAVQAWSVVGRPRAEVAVACALAAAVVAVGGRLGRGLGALSPTAFAVLLAALAVVPRLVWVTAVPTLPTSDYAGYEQAARAVLEGAEHGSPRQNLGVIVQLAASFAISGGSLVVAKLVNVLLAVAAAFGLLAVGRRITGEGSARLGAVLFALWPADVALRAVFATELGFVALLLPALALVIDLGPEPGPRLGRAALAGGLLAGAQAFRPVASLVLAVAVCWLVVRWWRPGRRQSAALAVMVAAFAVGIPLRSLLADSLGFRSPKSTLGMNLLAGTNASSQGRWNERDWTLLESIREDTGGSAAAAVAAAARVAAGRIAEDPAAFLVLQPEKLAVMWGDDTYGVYWSTREMAEGRRAAAVRAVTGGLAAWSQHAYVLLLGAVTVGLWRSRRRAGWGGATLVVLVVLAFVLVHVVLEVQNRYHHPWFLLLLPFAGLALSREPDARRGEEGSEGRG